MKTEKKQKPLAEKAPKEEKREKPIKIKERDINLVAALRAAEENDKKQLNKGKPSKMLYALGALGVLAMVGMYFNFYMQREALRSELELLEADLRSPLTTEKLDEAEQARLKSDYLKKLEKNTSLDLLALKNADSQYEYYTSELFAVIRQDFNGRINLTAIALEDNVVTLDLEAKKPSDAAEFVKRLRERNMFDDIEYVGFDSDEANGGALYSIVCTFEEPAADETALPEGGAEDNAFGEGDDF